MRHALLLDCQRYLLTHTDMLRGPLPCSLEVV
jgi:hypothetical protein